MNEPNAATYDQAFSELACVYVEDSWVLDVAATEFAIQFVVEAVLTPEHLNYQPRKPGEQHCYRRATLALSSAQPISFQRSEAPPARDVSGELDYGNIDTFIAVDWDGTEAWELTGDWGTALVKQPIVVLTLTP